MNKRIVRGRPTGAGRDTVREIPGAAGAAITLLEHGEISSPMHSDEVQLFVEARSMGVLNLFGDHPNAFDAESENTALLLAAHAAIALARTRQIENLTVALDSRDVIGQAKGILMERFKINAEEAFHLLVMSSQATHCKLRDVAAQLAETGELPLPERRY